MSYTKEQRQKNQELLDSEMKDYTQSERGVVKGEFNRTWPDDKQALKIINNHKAVIANEATPEEMEAVMDEYKF
ncbi:hypothetical protein ACVWYG_000718 [Pedobacter sp. UYEF25]